MRFESYVTCRSAGPLLLWEAPPPLTSNYTLRRAWRRVLPGPPRGVNSRAGRSLLHNPAATWADPFVTAARLSDYGLFPTMARRPLSPNRETHEDRHCRFRNSVARLRRRRGRRRPVRPARAPGSAGTENPRARAQAGAAGRSHEDSGVEHTGRARLAATGLPHPVRGCAERPAIARRAAIRRPVFPGRHHTRRPPTPGSCAACGRSSKARSTASTISASRPISRRAARSFRTRTSPRDSSRGPR